MSDEGYILMVWCPEHKWLTTMNEDGSPSCDGKPHTEATDDDNSDYSA